MPVTYENQQAGQVKVFCRKAGAPEARERIALSRSGRALAVSYRHRSAPNRPDGHFLDSALISRPGAEEIQLDLTLDYRSNVALYPEFQAYFRNHQPPLLAVSGRHYPAFTPSSADVHKRDLPNWEVHLLDTGHFALGTQAMEIAQFIRSFPGWIR